MSTPSEKGHAPIRILIVDDDADAADLLAEMIACEGDEAKVVNDGSDALAVIPEFHPQVVLLDIGLPGPDGWAVAKQIRSDPKSRGVILLALTGYSNADDLSRSVEAGFDDHLVKPLRIADLYRAIHRKLGETNVLVDSDPPDRARHD